MRHLTVRNVTPELARALTREQRREKKSLNETVIDLLRRALGLLTEDKEFDNGLGKFAGSWTEEQFQEFQRNTAFLDQPDEEPEK